MQRYRVNYRLFIGLIVGAVVAAGAVYGAWQINTNRNADNLLERANKAEKLEDATQLLESYVALRPHDSEAQIRLGLNYIELSKKALEAGDGNALRYRRNASTKLARYPDEQELRRALVDLDLLPRSFATSSQFNTETTGHIRTLLNFTPDDVDLLEGLARCFVFQKKPREAANELNRIIGYDPATGDFDTSKALDPNRLSAYQTYAFLVAYAIPRPQDPLPSLNDFALSRKLVDQMVAANPDNSEAYLARAQWFAMHDRGKDSRQDFESNTRQDLLKAVELDGKSTSAIQAVAMHFLQLGVRARDEAEQARNESNVAKFREHDEKSKEHFNVARDYLRQGLELDTSNANFYVRLAALERHSKNKEEADKIINEGLGKLTGEAKVYLEITQAEYMLEDGKIEEAEKLIRQFTNTRPRTDPALMYLQVKHALSTDDWRRVRDLGRELLPHLSGSPDRQLQLHLWLGFAHQKLAEPELAQESFRQALAIDPDNPIAIGNLKTPVASRSTRSSQKEKDIAVTQGNLMQQMKEMAERPESEQNWAPFEQFLKNRAEIEGWSPTRTKMSLAELSRFRKKYKESEDLLSEALKVASTDSESNEQTDVLLAAINLAATNPKRGPDAAIKMMDGIIAKYGDSPMFRIQRVRLLGARKNETMVEDVLALTKDMEGWKPQEIEVMWGTVASVFEQTRNPEQAEQALAELAKLRPGDLPIRIRMFKSALARSDEEAMKAAQDEILEIVGTKKDPNWAFTEAARLFATGETINEEQRKEVERLLAEILRVREEWHEPYFLRAKLKLTKGDGQGAFEDFQKGFELGPGTIVDLRVYGQLLVAQNRWREALQLVDKYEEDARIMILGERYPQALFATERYTDAVEAAERMLAMADPTPELHLWHAQFLTSAISLSPEVLPADQREAFVAMQKECREKQGIAIDKAIELRPDFPAAWLTKVRHHLTNSELDKAIATVQEAQLTIEDDVEPIVAAESYALLGRWFDAENLYVSIHQQNPDNTTVVRQLATFYLSPLYPRNDKVQKASGLINSVLEKVAKDPKSVPEVDAQWARRTAAQVLAAKKDYQSLLDAEKLLASNSVDGALPVADKAEMASILAPRPEQVSKRKAIQLLEEIETQSSLTLQQELMLANLYFETDNWPKARDAMDSLTARHPKSREVRDLYVRMLMVRNLPKERETLEVQMRQLRSIDPNSLTTLELTARAANLSGQSKAARDMLRKLVPADLGKADAKGILLAKQVARLLNELKDADGAEAIYRGLAEREGATIDDKAQLAHFVGIYRDPAAGFEMLENLQHEIDPLALVESALLITAAHRKDVGEAYDERVERWLNRALREDPESIALTLKQAEFRDQQGHYEDAAVIYRKMLENEDVTGQTRAVVCNNLAYMLALGVAKSNTPNEGVNYINEAVRLLGPVSDILDTRAVVYMRRGDYKSAADDLKLAVIDAPTSSKYFHLALAYDGLSQMSEARDAWEKAEKLGLTRDSVNVLEQEQYDKVAAKLKGS